MSAIIDKAILSDSKVIKIVEIEKPIEKIIERIIEKEVPVEVIKEIEKIVEIEKPVEVIREVEIVKQDESKIKELESEIQNLKQQLSSTVDYTKAKLDDALSIKADSASSNASAGFGSSFPANPSLGQLFLRLDTLPNTLYKWNGKKWMMVDKNQNTSYVNNEKIVDSLIQQLKEGTIEWEDLTTAEQDAIKPAMKKEQFLGQ